GDAESGGLLPCALATVHEPERLGVRQVDPVGRDSLGRRVPLAFNAHSVPGPVALVDQPGPGQTRNRSDRRSRPDCIWTAAGNGAGAVAGLRRRQRSAWELQNVLSPSPTRRAVPPIPLAPPLHP